MRNIVFFLIVIMLSSCASGPINPFIKTYPRVCKTIMISYHVNDIVYVSFAQTNDYGDTKKASLFFQFYDAKFCVIKGYRKSFRNYNVRYIRIGNKKYFRSDKKYKNSGVFKLAHDMYAYVRRANNKQQALQHVSTNIPIFYTLVMALENSKS